MEATAEDLEAAAEAEADAEDAREVGIEEVKLAEAREETTELAADWRLVFESMPETARRARASGGSWAKRSMARVEGVRVRRSGRRVSREVKRMVVVIV